MQQIRIVMLAFCSAVLLMAQAPAGGQKSASLARSADETNEEKNIRAYMELLRSDVRKAKSQIVGEVMQFDADQASRFWPIYKEFEAELTRNGDQVAALIKDYATNYASMTPAVADQLATRLLDIEQGRTQLKRKYYERVKAALDPITAARFLQVENQLERILDLQLAAQLPVIQ